MATRFWSLLFFVLSCGCSAFLHGKAYTVSSTRAIHLSQGFSRNSQQEASTETDVKSEISPQTDFDAWFWGGGESSVGADDAVFAQDQRPIILFDGVCAFCDAGVNFFMDNDANPSGSFRFSAMQSELGECLLHACGKKSDDFSSIVFLDTNHHYYFKSDAVLKIAEGLKMPFPQLASVGKVLPQSARDYIYDFVSEHRTFLGEKDSCRIPEDDVMDRFL